VSVVCGGGIEMDEPASAALDPLLLTTTGIPRGYVSSGVNTATSSLVFGGELPRSVPVAALSYGEDVQVTGGLVMEDLDEALAEDTSGSAASALAEQLQTATAGCSPDSGTVHLPGAVPGLVATTLMRSDVPTTIVTNEIVGASTAEVYASKGPYLVEVSWANSLSPEGAGTAAPPPLPTPAMMATVVDAALGRLPG
jgi:hypothetical protein